MFHRIAKVVKLFSFMLLNWQGQFLQKRVIKRIGYDEKKAKRNVKGCTLELTNEDKINAKQVDEEVELILKRCKDNVLAVKNFFETNKVCIYQIKNVEKTLSRINEREGFITERTGMRAIFLNFITNRTLGLKSSNMVVLESGDLSMYSLMRALHKWVAFKNGLEGLDEKSQKLLRRFDVENDNKVIGRLSLKDIERVRAAVARDVQSIDFVVNYAKAHEGGKKVLNKMKDEGGANI